jgi:acetoin utilization deacetylase AcuC-like enzyme
LNRGLANKILIVDLDVHQGNGNSEIFKNENNVFTFSMHTKVNYPPIKSKSDLDIELEQNMEDDQYLDILKQNLIFLNDFNFDFVFYIAGVDIHLDDRLGKLCITDKGINKRDEMVIRNFFTRRVPICGVLGGGYNKDFKKLIELHASLHKNCAKYLNDKK